MVSSKTSDSSSTQSRRSVKTGSLTTLAPENGWFGRVLEGRASCLIEVYAPRLSSAGGEVGRADGIDRKVSGGCRTLILRKGVPGVAVVVLGSINLDLIARIKRVPKAGETGLAHSMTTSPGGKGANQALAAQRLGAPTTMLGMIGGDAFAMQALKFLRQDGVDLSRIRVSKDLPTGLAMIVVEDSGQNAITVVPGANAGMDDAIIEDLGRTLQAKDTLLMQLEIPFDIVERAMNLARKVRARVILDPAPAVDRLPKSFYRADIMVPNQFEAQTLLGVTITDVRSAKAAARQLRSRGPEVAVIKLGEQGVVWSTARGLFYLPAEEVQAVDAVGAGDVFAGALASRLDAGAALADAIRLANRAAAWSTTRQGAQPSFPWMRDLNGPDQ